LKLYFIYQQIYLSLNRDSQEYSFGIGFRGVSNLFKSSKTTKFIKIGIAKKHNLKVNENKHEIEKILEAKLQLNLEIHKEIEKISNETTNRPNFSNIDEKIKPYITNFWNFYTSNYNETEKFEDHLCGTEISFLDSQSGYCGTLDAIFVFGNEILVVVYKSGMKRSNTNAKKEMELCLNAIKSYDCFIGKKITGLFVFLGGETFKTLEVQNHNFDLLDSKIPENQINSICNKMNIQVLNKEYCCDKLEDTMVCCCSCKSWKHFSCSSYNGGENFLCSIGCNSNFELGKRLISKFQNGKLKNVVAKHFEIQSFADSNFYISSWTNIIQNQFQNEIFSTKKEEKKTINKKS